MIINTGQRTDIPAFYSEWFANRLCEGYVLVRNPYNPQSVARYRLTPDVVDLIGFCTKNPEPMLRYMDLLEPFGQFWYVTITPYGRNIEPHVPNKNECWKPSSVSPISLARTVSAGGMTRLSSIRPGQ